MARSRNELDAERRRIFRRMEWLFVYLPPFLIVLVALAAGALLAWAFRWGSMTFWQRWMLGSLLLVLIPGAVYLVRSWWENRK